MNNDLKQVRSRSSVGVERSAKNNGNGRGDLVVNRVIVVLVEDREGTFRFDDRIVNWALCFEYSAGIPTKRHRSNGNMSSEKRMISNERVESE